MKVLDSGLGQGVYTESILIGAKREDNHSPREHCNMSNAIANEISPNM